MSYEIRWNGKCHRCYQPATTHTMSYFNTDLIGYDCGCAKREQEHPDYQKAKDAEMAACRRGDNNFPGIGLPEDLR